MAGPWDPEHPVDEELAFLLVAEQFPELAETRPHLLGQGFDKDVWRFSDLVFRFPRRPLGAKTLSVEARVLPGLAPRLTLPIPIPSHFGQPSERFPWPFIGHRLVEGTTGDRAALGRDARWHNAATLAGFVRGLHDVDRKQAEALGVPIDHFRVAASTPCTSETRFCPSNLRLLSSTRKCPEDSMSKACALSPV